MRAVECALALPDLDASLRLVVHAGEVRVSASGVEGGSVGVAAAVLGATTADVIVTSVVRDLAPGSGLDFSEDAELSVPEAAGCSCFASASPP